MERIQQASQAQVERREEKLTWCSKAEAVVGCGRLHGGEDQVIQAASEKESR